jgi:hypothetical protein
MAWVGSVARIRADERFVRFDLHTQRQNMPVIFTLSVLNEAFNG